MAPARPRVELGDERSADRTSAALRSAWDEPEREPVLRIGRRAGSGDRRRRRSIADPPRPRVEFGDERRAERTSASRVGRAVPGSRAAYRAPSRIRIGRGPPSTWSRKPGRDVPVCEPEAWRPEAGRASDRATFVLVAAAMVVRSSKTRGARGLHDRVGQRAPVGNAPGERRGAAAIAASRSRSAKPRPGRSTK